jgi:acyl carrier protein
MHRDLQRLASLLERELGVDPATLSPQSRLDDIADSLDWASFMGELERHLGRRIGAEESLSLRTVADLMRLFEEGGLAWA